MSESTQSALSEIMAGYITGQDGKKIPPHLLEHSKTAFLDWLGCVIGGHDQPVTKKVEAFADILGGHEQSSLIFGNRKVNMLYAACVNGASAHILGYDDTMKIYIGHSSAVLFPGLLSLAEYRKVTGLDFLTAHVIAFKVAAVLGSLAGLAPYRKGWWTTTTVGGVAAAAGCSRLMGLSKDRTRVALGIAANMASGIKAVFGSEAKAFHAGHVSGGGITAALLAGEDLTCSDRMLEGVDGYLQVFDGETEYDPQKLFDEIWEFNELAQKYHVSCHFAHSSVESVLRMMEDVNLRSEEVKKIDVTVSELAFKAAGKYKIESILDAKFSIPYCISNTIIRKNTDMAMFTDEMIREQEVLKFMGKVSLIPTGSAGPMAAEVIIEKTDGTVLTRSVDVFSEIPDIDEKKERIINKFGDICAETIASENIGRIVEDVMNLDLSSNIGMFVDDLNNNLITGRIGK